MALGIAVATPRIAQAHMGYGEGGVGVMWMLLCGPPLVVFLGVLLGGLSFCETRRRGAAFAHFARITAGLLTALFALGGLFLSDLVPWVLGLLALASAVAGGLAFAVARAAERVLAAVAARSGEDDSRAT